MKRKTLIPIIIFPLLIVILYLYVQFSLIPRHWRALQTQSEEYGLTLKAKNLTWRLPSALIIRNVEAEARGNRVTIEKMKVRFSLSPGEMSPIPLLQEGRYAHLKDISWEGGQLLLPEGFTPGNLTFRGDFTSGTSPRLTINTPDTLTQLTFEAGEGEELKLTCLSEGLWAALGSEGLPFSLEDLDYGVECSFDLPFQPEEGIQLSLEMAKGTMDFPLLAREKVEWEDVSLKTELSFAQNDGQLKQLFLENMEWQLGQVALSGDLSYQTGEDQRVLKSQISLPTVKVQHIIDSLPTAILGKLEGLEAQGEFAWESSVSIPLENPEAAEWESTPVLTDFDVTRIPEGVNVYGLNETFPYYLDTPDGLRYLPIDAREFASMEWMTAVSEHTVGQTRYWRNWAKVHSSPAPEIIPGENKDAIPALEDYRYTRLDEMSLYIPKAVLTGEDGDFFFHNGINWLTFRQALLKNFTTGEVQLGASTITMQLIKNLFLTQQQTVVRKLQEAFLVFLTEMEVSVVKDRTFEIYLNIAEFGPGIYGIDQASRHFFGKDPLEITLGEAVYLTSILPAPNSYYEIYESGEIDRKWFLNMKYYFDIMVKRERITQEEYNEAIKAPPRFYRADE
ncbi:MAG: transglycosylase domain-containing protein [Spirochaetales bacterium]|nr:transglycosylase domain-containing protein [Spirochaetales bacterium]